MASVLPQALRQALPALAVVVLGLLASAWLAQQQAQAGRTTAQVRLTEEVRASTDALAQRMQAFAEVVASVSDIFLVNPELSHQQFAQVAQAHNYEQRYPELRNLSFARWVPAGQMAAFEARLAEQARLRGLAPRDFVHPRVQLAEHHIIEYLWPQGRNQGVWGLDIATQPANLEAIERGRASGQMVLSAPFDMVQEQERRQAVVLRGPVFVDAPPQGQPGQPGGRYLGSVTATLRVSELLEQLHQRGYLNGVALRLEDLGSTEDAGPATARFMGEFGFISGIGQGAPPIRRALEVQGRRWRLSYVPTRSLLSPAEQALPWWIGLGGALVALLLGLLTHLLLRQRAQALLRVDRSLQELAQSEARFRAVFNQAAVGVSLTHADSGRFERVNQRYCELLGYSAAELLATDVQHVSHPEDWAANAVALERVRRGELSEFRLEKRLQHRDGRSIWVDLTLSCIRQEGGAPLLHVGVIQDITERRQIQQALAESEQRLRAILDHLPVGVLLVTQEGSVIFRSRGFVDITGYTEEMLQHVRQWWGWAYPDAAVRERVIERWERLCEQAPQAGGVIAAGEYEIVRADGQTRIVDISGVLLGENHLVIFEDLTVQRAAQEEVNYLAHFDPLTQLPNRHQLLDLLRQRLQACTQHSQCGALLLLDLDHFKKLNETRGHDWGDQLLRQFAERLRLCLHEQARVARHGDDEFVVLLGPLSVQPEEAAAQARAEGERILQVLHAPFVLGSEPYHGTASMGAVIFCGSEESAQELLKKADLAMHQAKAAGRAQLQFYDPRVQAQLHERALLERDLRQGLEQGQLALYYQPQMDMGGRITGCEALLRWQHPERGLVSPATFIPLAEETGLILPLGQWVLQQACAQLARWAEQPLFAPLSLAVNVSAQQFHQDSFVPNVLAALAGSGANPRSLELELTESLLLQDVQETIAKMVQLKGYGLRFALDDFGTGYSSLAYLKRLPLDQLKIDQGFVRDVLVDPNDAAIARTIVALGSSLGLRVIAEGVETEAQRAFLQRAQCHAWQGYLKSRALPAADFEALVLAQ